MPHDPNTPPTSPQFVTTQVLVPQIHRCAKLVTPSPESQIVNNFVVNHVETINLETSELNQNWADYVVAFVCWDMIMNQWSEVFHL